MHIQLRGINKGCRFIFQDAMRLMYMSADVVFGFNFRYFFDQLLAADISVIHCQIEYAMSRTMCYKNVRIGMNQVPMLFDISSTLPVECPIVKPGLYG